MVSMVLGLLLMLGIVRVYLDSKLNYTADEEVARVQENGRFALNLLKRELTLAGFYGGDLSVKDMAPAAVTTDCAATDWVLDPTEPVDHVGDYNNSLLTVHGVTLTCLTEADGLVHVLPGTDILSIKRTAGDFTLRNGAYHPTVTAAKADQWYLQRRDYGGNKAWHYVGAGGAFNSAHVGTNTQVDYWEGRKGGGLTL